MLGYILKEYETMMRTVIPDMKQLYRPYLSELESALRPALTVLTWTSTSVDEFIQNVIATMEGISEMCRKVRHKNLDLGSQIFGSWPFASIPRLND
jgi:hypothetical protein